MDDLEVLAPILHIKNSKYVTNGLNCKLNETNQIEATIHCLIYETDSEPDDDEREIVNGKTNGTSDSLECISVIGGEHFCGPYPVVKSFSNDVANIIYLDDDENEDDDDNDVHDNDDGVVDDHETIADEQLTVQTDVEKSASNYELAKSFTEPIKCLEEDIMQTSTEKEDDSEIIFTLEVNPRKGSKPKIIFNSFAFKSSDALAADVFPLPITCSENSAIKKEYPSGDTSKKDSKIGASLHEKKTVQSITYTITEKVVACAKDKEQDMRNSKSPPLKEQISVNTSNLVEIQPENDLLEKHPDESNEVDGSLLVEISSELLDQSPTERPLFSCAGKYRRGRGRPRKNILIPKKDISENDQCNFSPSYEYPDHRKRKYVKNSKRLALDDLKQEEADKKFLMNLLSKNRFQQSNNGHNNDENEEAKKARLEQEREPGIVGRKDSSEIPASSGGRNLIEIDTDASEFLLDIRQSPRKEARRMRRLMVIKSGKSLSSSQKKRPVGRPKGCKDKSKRKLKAFNRIASLRSKEISTNVEKLKEVKNSIPGDLEKNGTYRVPEEFLICEIEEDQNGPEIQEHTSDQPADISESESMHFDPSEFLQQRLFESGSPEADCWDSRERNNISPEYDLLNTFESDAASFFHSQAYLRTPTHLRDFLTSDEATQYAKPLRRPPKSETREKLRRIKAQMQFVCEICGITKRVFGEMYDHLRIHSPYNSSGTPDILHCPKCNQTLYLSDLTHLLKDRVVSRCFSCLDCNKTFNQVANVGHHVRVHTNDKEFACQICLRTFRTLSNHKTHLKTHVGEFPYSCEICGRVFKENYKKERCMRSHQQSVSEHINVANELCQNSDEIDQ